jgi:hypothetical protein
MNKKQELELDEEEDELDELYEEEEILSNDSASSGAEGSIVLPNSRFNTKKELQLHAINRSISEAVIRESDFEFELHDKNNPLTSSTVTTSVWTSKNESILFEWCDNAQCYIWLHNRSCNQCSFYYSSITIPCIVLSTITGSAALATNSFPIETHFYEFIIIGTINIFVGILNMLEHFLKFSERKESHRLSSISWDKFLRNIRVELAKMPRERMEVGQFLKLCNRDYDHLIESSPVITTDIINQFNKTFSGNPGSSTRKRFDELKKPDICDSMMTTQEQKYKKHTNKSKSKKLDVEKREPPEDFESNVKIINIYIDTFCDMFGRKPLVYEIIDNLKNKVNKETLGHFLENYTIEDAIQNV